VAQRAQLRTSLLVAVIDVLSLSHLPCRPPLHIKSPQDWKIIMELWNDYEGRTIAGTYPLVKLLEPEGRSAFFSTTNGTGKPIVIRLIESHFDDEEILARWRAVQELDHPNLIKLKSFGQVELDGTSLVYAVMEPAEANLGEILQERRLAVSEAKQVAESLVAALVALHARGFVHEHIEPGNVMAVGETIKLRSDCVREAAEGAEGKEMMRKDVHDLAVLLLRALTQRRTLESAARDLPLAEPFDQIVKKGISGEWGLKEIAAKVPPVSAPVAAKAVAPAAKPVPAPVPAAAVPAVGPAVKPASPAAASVSPAAASAGPVANAAPARPAARESSAGLPLAGPFVVKEESVSSPVGRIRVPVEDESGDGKRWAIYGVVGLLILALAIYLLRGHSTKTAAAPQASSAPAPAVKSSAAPATAELRAPGAADVSSMQPVVGTGHGQWRVVAFTYNHQDQAQHKAETMAKDHSDLSPSVFTPNGHAPYLVTLGGPMSRAEAFALSGKAKREGLPRDIYAQNYRNAGR
jgi:hypothetical protein